MTQTPQTHYWHFCAIDANGRPVLRDGSLALEPGQTETYDGQLSLCSAGLHMSLLAIDALQYAPGAWCRIVRPGDMVESAADKLCSTERYVVASFDATAVLHEAACWIAEAALLLAGVEDPRYWTAIEAKRAWLRGECSSEQLGAARAADDAADAWAAADTWAAADADTWAAAASCVTWLYQAALSTTATSAATMATGDAAAAAARDAAWAEINAALEAALLEDR